METIIEVKDLCKEFKIYHHRKGFFGTFANIFSQRHTIIRAVDKVAGSMMVYDWFCEFYKPDDV